MSRQQGQDKDKQDDKKKKSVFSKVIGKITPKKFATLPKNKSVEENENKNTDKKNRRSSLPTILSMRNLGSKSTTDLKSPTSPTALKHQQVLWKHSKYS